MPTYESLRKDYTARWAAMEIRPLWAARARQAAGKILAARGRYEPVSAATGVPWAVVGIIHLMEADGSFKSHLHNGDPLTSRTKQVPKGRPLTGKPPFAWEVSAIDALTYDELDKITDWCVERLAWCLEKFNGFGPRDRGVPSAYLWSGTDQYTKGKYVSDGAKGWRPNAVSDQVGGMAIYRALTELDTSIAFEVEKPVKSAVGAAVDVVKTALTPAPKAPAKPTLLAVMQSRVGITEIPGESENNPIILEWFKLVGHPEIHADETSWCAVALGAALIEAGLPTTPINVNMLARSYESYGTAVAVDDIQPGDIAVWPRAEAWQGHVNVVEQIVGDGAARKVICIGGNQSADEGADAVNRSRPRLTSQAVCFRRPVQSTVPALREAGSTDIQDGDNVQKVGGIGAFLLSAFAALKELWAPVATAPEVTSVPEALTFWQQVLGSLNAVGRLFLANPWLGGIAFVGLMLVWVGYKMKQKRVAKAAAGMPLHSQVVPGAVAEGEAT